MKIHRVAVLLVLSSWACGSSNAGPDATARDAAIDAAGDLADAPPCDTTSFAGAGTDTSPFVLCDGALLPLIDDTPAMLSAVYI